MSSGPTQSTTRHPRGFKSSLINKTARGSRQLSLHSVVLGGVTGEVESHSRWAQAKTLLVTPRSRECCPAPLEDPTPICKQKHKQGRLGWRRTRTPTHLAGGFNRNAPAGSGEWAGTQPLGTAGNGPCTKGVSVTCVPEHTPEAAEGPRAELEGQEGIKCGFS